jgi:hypothetical protein
MLKVRKLLKTQIAELAGYAPSTVCWYKKRYKTKSRSSIVRRLPAEGRSVDVCVRFAIGVLSVEYLLKASNILRRQIGTRENLCLADGELLLADVARQGAKLVERDGRNKVLLIEAKRNRIRGTDWHRFFLVGHFSPHRLILTSGHQRKYKAELSS